MRAKSTETAVHWAEGLGREIAAREQAERDRCAAEAAEAARVERVIEASLPAWFTEVKSEIRAAAVAFSLVTRAEVRAFAEPAILRVTAGHPWAPTAQLLVCRGATSLTVDRRMQGRAERWPLAFEVDGEELRPRPAELVQQLLAPLLTTLNPLEDLDS